MTRRPPVHVDVQHLHELHATRMKTWHLPHGDDYEFDVVHRVLDWARGMKEEPIAHPHAQREMGMCLECDAAALVERWIGLG